MECRCAQTAISERMDGEHLLRRVSDALDRHVAECAECAAFEASAWELREHVRFGVAENVPDLIEPIMAAVWTEAATGRDRAPVATLEPPRSRTHQPAPPRLHGWNRRSLAPLVAAALVGAIIGSVVAGGLLSSEPTPLAAADIVRAVDAAATTVRNYSATFAVTEYHFSPVVPVRRFTVDVDFSAPEKLRLDVVDNTPYPSSRFTPNDLSLVVNGSRSSSFGAGSCGSAQLRCSVRDRAPFSPSTPLPTDLIVPVSTLGQAEGLHALERSRISGRPAIRVELSYARAAPLFPYLEMGGAWRPYFPDDRVVLWLDARTYLPLRTAVFPSADPARRAWERSRGLPHESAASPILESSMLSFDRGRSPTGTFRVGAGTPASSEGARGLELGSVEADAGFGPVLPVDRGGLALYRVVEMSGVDAGSVLVTYANGLSYLKVQESATWSGPTPYGGVEEESKEVPLPNGTALYAPATPVLGRRLSIHADDLDVYLETNLPRRELLHIAGSLSLRALPLPASWNAQGEPERFPLDRIADAVPFRPLVPAELPSGYGVASAQLDSAGDAAGFSIFYEQRSSDLAGPTLRIHEEPATSLPPASSAHQSIVGVRGQDARFTPDRNELEWVENGVYVAIDGNGLRLAELLSIAAMLR